MGPDENIDLKEQLKSELMKELKDELKKELAESSKEAKSKSLKKSDLDDNSAVLTSTGNIKISKPFLKVLNWRKGDVVKYKIDQGKLIIEKIGHTDAAAKVSKKAAEDGTADGEIQVEASSDLVVGKYFEYDLMEKKAPNEVRKYIENSYKLYKSGNYNDGLKILEMIDNIELKEEEPDRSKMRLTIINYLADILPKFPAAVSSQVPAILEISKKISSRYLQEKAYGLIALVCKDLKHWEYFDQIVEILYNLLLKYSDTEMFGIISLLEITVFMIADTPSKFIDDYKNYILSKFDIITDFDYKIRVIQFLNEMNCFKEARELASSIKKDTLEGSHERRLVLDIMKEIREKGKDFFEKNPDLLVEKKEETPESEPEPEEDIVEDQPTDDSEVTEDELEDNEVTEDDLEDSEVTEDDLEDSEVTEDDLEDSEGTEDDLEDSEVTEDDLEDSEGTEDDLEDSEVTEDDLEDSEVTEDDLEDSEVTEDDLEDDSDSEDE
ncbi:MAG: hypothetical protein ACFFCS_05045 [Candidatus Hodarchaeota archaeon]